MMKTNEKLLFLDCDGVINRYKTIERVGQWIFCEDMLVDRVARIIHDTGAKVVLTSTWREGYWERTEQNIKDDIVTLYDALETKLKEYNVKIDYYIPMYYNTITRGEDIAKWFDEIYKAEPKSMIILDDEQHLFPYGRYLLQTSAQSGITEKQVRLAISRLNGECDV